MPKSSGERFWAKVQKGDGCWEWQGYRDAGGYGRLTVQRRPELAHRMAFYLTYGPFEGYVLHACDNPPCVRPDHLFVGGQKANMQDASSKRRIANLRKTHCPNGHVYDEENTRWYEGRRYCRACRPEYRRRYRANHPELRLIERERMRQRRSLLRR